MGAMRPLADPGCGSLLGEGMVLDARAALLATVLLPAPRAQVLAALLATLVAAHLGTALLWNHVTPGCGTDTASASVFLMAGLTAAWLFARRMQRLGTEYDLARAEAAEAECASSPASRSAPRRSWSHGSRPRTAVC